MGPGLSAIVQVLRMILETAGGKGQPIAKLLVPVVALQPVQSL
jgi:hypothetical protein